MIEGMGYLETSCRLGKLLCRETVVAPNELKCPMLSGQPEKF